MKSDRYNDRAVSASLSVQNIVPSEGKGEDQFFWILDDNGFKTDSYQ
jgi:hypothetical protein